MTTLTRRMIAELRDQLLDAKINLRVAIAAIEYYVRETDDRHAEAYILDQLKILAGRDHGFLAGDANLDDLIDGLAEYEAADEPDDDDPGYMSEDDPDFFDYMSHSDADPGL